MKFKLITSFLAIALFFYSCEKQDNLYSIGNSVGPKVSDVISFIKVPSMAVEADSVSIDSIGVQINPETDSIYRTVLFKISSGKFTNDDTVISVTANASGYAYVGIRNTKAERVRLQASIKGIIIDTSLLFVDALPDNILLNSDSYVNDTLHSFTVSTSLFRNPRKGVPTDPVQVYYKVKSNSKQNLVYNDFAFSSNHVASVNISNPYKIRDTFQVTSYILKPPFNDTIAKKTITLVVK